MVGIADDQFAMGCRADQQVNTLFMQVGCFTQDLRPHRLRLRQVGEGAVVHATQTGEQGVLQVKVGLRPGTEHLQAADLRLERDDRIGQQGLIVMAGADDDLLAGEAARRAVYTTGFDIAHQGREVERHAKVATQVVDQGRDRFARVQLLVIQAMQGCAVVTEPAAVQAAQRGTAQQFDTVTVLDGAPFTEGFQQVFLGFGSSEQVRTVALERQTGKLRPSAPDLATGLGQLAPLARWLARDQSLAKIAHRGAQRRGAAFEDPDLEAALSGGIGVGQTENAGADDQQVVVLCH
ncbi:hypothetical protein D3C78_1034240 [compost metagenome]